MARPRVGAERRHPILVLRRHLDLFVGDDILLLQIVNQFFQVQVITSNLSRELG